MSDMYSEPQPYGPLQEPSPGKPPRRVPRLAVAAGVTAFLGLVGAGLAFAVGGGGAPAHSLSSSSSPSTTTTVPKPMHPRGGRFGSAKLGFGPGLGNVVHGQYTTNQGGTFKTIAVQTGQVAAVSANSISVKSADGVTQTYAVQASTIVDSQAGGISTVQKSDTVNVQALVQGQTLTATNIVDVTKVGSSRKGFGLMPPGSQGAGGAARVGPPFPPTAAA